MVIVSRNHQVRRTRLPSFLNNNPLQICKMQFHWLLGMEWMGINQSAFRIQMVWTVTWDDAERMKPRRKHRKCSFFPTKLSFSRSRLKFPTFQGLKKKRFRIPDPVATLVIVGSVIYKTYIYDTIVGSV